VAIQIQEAANIARGVLMTEHIIIGIIAYIVGGATGVAILALFLASRNDEPQITVSEIGRRVG
jgi:hypothetical protein